MSKAFRHEQIRKLVRGRPLHSQVELAEALRRAGVEATQVTLSRDLKELGLVKTPTGYAEMDAVAPLAAVSQTAHIVREFVRDLRPAQNLLVVKTSPGAASSVGAALDSAAWSEIAGSLAGDDTVLIICEDGRQRAAVQSRLRAMLEE